MGLWFVIWATSWQNPQNDCAPSKDSDQPGRLPSLIKFLLCFQWVAKNPSLLHADSEDSDQTRWMPRLIWIFVGRACHFVGFVMRQLICYLFLLVLVLFTSHIIAHWQHCSYFSVSQEEISKLQADHDQVGLDLFDTKQQLLDQLDANHVLTELKYTHYTGCCMMDDILSTTKFGLKCKAFTESFKAS